MAMWLMLRTFEVYRSVEVCRWSLIPRFSKLAVMTRKVSLQYDENIKLVLQLEFFDMSF